MNHAIACLCIISITMTVIASASIRKSHHYMKYVGYINAAAADVCYDETKVQTYIECLLTCSDEPGCLFVNYR